MTCTADIFAATFVINDMKWYVTNVLKWYEVVWHDLKWQNIIAIYALKRYVQKSLKYQWHAFKWHVYQWRVLWYGNSLSRISLYFKMQLCRKYAYLGFGRKYASLETEKERSRGVMPQKYGYVKKWGEKVCETHENIEVKCSEVSRTVIV